jgi:cell division protein FtsI/penicillin-binding protein 2
MAIKWQRRFIDTLENRLQSTRLRTHKDFGREFYMLLFFGFLFSVIVLRLGYIQLIQADYYDRLLSSQHISRSNLKADR